MALRALSLYPIETGMLVADVIGALGGVLLAVGLVPQVPLLLYRLHQNTVSMNHITTSFDVSQGTKITSHMSGFPINIQNIMGRLHVHTSS